jgi:hypothetical protein
MRDHLPDSELDWPPGTTLSWAGECWAIQAELARTTEIMRERLARDL